MGWFPALFAADNGSEFYFTYDLTIVCWYILSLQVSTHSISFYNCQTQVGPTCNMFLQLPELLIPNYQQTCLTFPTGYKFQRGRNCIFLLFTLLCSALDKVLIHI